MPFIAVGAENSAPIDLYYTDYGSGPPVVLIHGYPLSGAAWEKQVPTLLGAGYRVITYDRRGFGNSAQPGSGYDYDTFASDLNTLMTELDLRDAVLIGHSMGTGEIARYLGTYGSARVNRAVTISTLGPMLLKTDDNPEGLDRSLFEGFLDAAASDRYAYQTTFLNNFFNWPDTRGKRVSEDAYRGNWNLSVSASPIATYECIKTWMTDFRADIPRIDVPLLIIHGSADKVLPYPNTAPRLHEMLPDSQLVTLQDAPHAIPWTHPEEVNGAIMQFIGAPEPAMAR
ncbi:alpha/beta fold hydrolase [Plantactinospora siamensis]|uniref:Alpha/beta fold hydrolase n=1 Tax=Plantactinospora siamensis TaxID=555372 RepID=A0ABV6P5U0_9ACTN